jgi:hypothetical protein
VSGAGDLGLALRWSLKNPAGDGLSIAVQPFVTAPTGANGIGGDLWQGGVIVANVDPAVADWSLSLSPQVEARENASGSGRHAATPSPAASAARSGRSIWARSCGSIATRTRPVTCHPGQLRPDRRLDAETLKDVQLDASAYAGLNRQTPDLELVVGLAHRF